VRRPWRHRPRKRDRWMGPLAASARRAASGSHLVGVWPLVRARDRSRPVGAAAPPSAVVRPCAGAGDPGPKSGRGDGSPVAQDCRLTALKSLPGGGTRARFGPGRPPRRPIRVASMRGIAAGRLSSARPGSTRATRQAGSAATAGPSSAPSPGCTAADDVSSATTSTRASLRSPAASSAASSSTAHPLRPRQRCCQTPITFPAGSRNVATHRSPSGYGGSTTSPPVRRPAPASHRRAPRRRTARHPLLRRPGGRP